MYPFAVKKLCIVESIQNDPLALERAHRLSSALGVQDPQIISREQAASLRAGRPAEQACEFLPRTGAFDYSKGWTVVLDSYVDGARQLKDGIVRTTFRDGSRQMGGIGVCQSALELHCAWGCLHRCAYCFVDPHFLIICDLESLAARIPEYCEKYPNQKLYKFDNWTDTIVLEPEYGASELFVPLFGKLDGKYLLLYTKSDNVDHLLDLDHNGHTIINWSLSFMEQSRSIEVNTPDTAARIQAMKKCQDAGYTVRARISPIVPLIGWRKGISEMLEMLFSSVDPDVVTIDMVGWCHPEALADAMDISRLDQPFLDEVNALMGTGACTGEKYLFSHGLRKSVLGHTAREIKRWSPKTAVAICNETWEMWQDLRHVLTGKPGNYACCCGPDSVPGHHCLVGQ